MADNENEQLEPIDLAVGIPSEEQAGLQSERIKEAERGTANWLAKGILIIFGIVSIVMLTGIFVGWFLDKTDTNTLELAKTILPYLATPLGVALGYYFTRQEKSS